MDREDRERGIIGRCGLNRYFVDHDHSFFRLPYVQFPYEEIDPEDHYKSHSAYRDPAAHRCQVGSSPENHGHNRPHDTHVCDRDYQPEK